MSKIKLLALTLLLIAIGCNKNVSRSTNKLTPELKPLSKALAGYEAMSIPDDNPMSPDKVALGRQLFFDERLSGDGTKSCSSCHVCEHGLTDGLPKAIGAGNKTLTRNSPTLWNIGYHKEFYWDGRSGSLEAQALADWSGANMGAVPELSVKKLNGLEEYATQFHKVFDADPTPDNVVKAIAAFERTIIAGDTAWDRWKAGDNTAISVSAYRGWNIFQAIKCNNCHDGLLFTDQQYHNIGIGMDATEPDLGRLKVTNKPEDTGAFKTPTLRDIANTAPYFHDGSAQTLEEAVDLMLGGGKPNDHLDKKNLVVHKLLPEQRQDLLAFLRSLSVECSLEKPDLPQK
ncbi:MAG TPA: cytochrome c peroxidase [Pyrinomonadaceae bacterium]